MVRRSTPARIDDDRDFPVRVRVAIPERGFGNQLNEMHGWLNMHAGRGKYAVHSTNAHYAALGCEAMFVYFVDIGVAKAFVERFSCGLAVVKRVERDGA
jgi:hypothetical protein